MTLFLIHFPYFFIILQSWKVRAKTAYLTQAFQIMSTSVNTAKSSYVHAAQGLSGIYIGQNLL
jgi:hypothetical protein